MGRVIQPVWYDDATHGLDSKQELSAIELPILFHLFGNFVVSINNKIDHFDGSGTSVDTSNHKISKIRELLENLEHL